MGISRTICALILLTTACSKGDSEDTAVDMFMVAGTAPENGDVNVLVGQAPEFRFNATADEEACDSSHFVFVGMDESGEVAFDVVFDAQFQDEGNKVVLTHSTPLLQGYWYAAMSVNGDPACLDTDGRPLEPYGIEFFVP